MREPSVLLIYGEGGHRAQMKRLLSLIDKMVIEKGFSFVGICENKDCIVGFQNYSQKGVRDKYHKYVSLVTIPYSIYKSIKICTKLLFRHKVVSVISTGPGLAIVPSLFFKLLGAKIIFIETWSRFETRSITGRLMYLIAERFYVQHPSLKKYYPKAIYKGLL